MKRSIWILSWITRFSIQMVSALILLTPTVKPTVGKQKDYIAHKLSNWEISWEVTRERHAKADARVGGLHARSLSLHVSLVNGHHFEINYFLKGTKSETTPEKEEGGADSLPFGVSLIRVKLENQALTMVKWWHLRGNYKFGVFKIFIILSINSVLKLFLFCCQKQK